MKKLCLIIFGILFLVVCIASVSAIATKTEWDLTSRVNLIGDTWIAKPGIPDGVPVDPLPLLIKVDSSKPLKASLSDIDVYWWWDMKSQEPVILPLKLTSGQQKLILNIEISNMSDDKALFYGCKLRAHSSKGRALKIWLRDNYEAMGLKEGTNLSYTVPIDKKRGILLWVDVIGLTRIIAKKKPIICDLMVVLDGNEVEDNNTYIELSYPGTNPIRVNFSNANTSI